MALTKPNNETSWVRLGIIFLIFLSALFLIFYFGGDSLNFLEKIVSPAKIEKNTETNGESQTHPLVFGADQALNQLEIILKEGDMIQVMNNGESRIFFVTSDNGQEVMFPVEPETEGAFYRLNAPLSEDSPFFIKNEEGEILAEGKIKVANQ